MKAPPGDAGYAYITSFGNPGDGNWWYSLAEADGSPVQLLLTAYATCDACDELPDPIGFGWSVVPPDGGATTTWDGTAVTGISTCQGSATSPQGPGPFACNTFGCMPAGEYVVTMCAVDSVQGGLLEDAGTHCISVPFHYPATSDVVGNLPLLRDE
jgi:hypothetical protein